METNQPSTFHLAPAHRRNWQIGLAVTGSEYPSSVVAPKSPPLLSSYSEAPWRPVGNCVEQLATHHLTAGRLEYSGRMRSLPTASTATSSGCHEGKALPPAAPPRLRPAKASSRVSFRRILEARAGGRGNEAAWRAAKRKKRKGH
uniref:Uncharacterized protein n=1 Tax=Leersia perrieri TaxID=77586 RepID=A0A0D9V2P1_9ORYZ